ncbi:hemagglutinin repeat-containing protein [Pseudomonas cremoricolorata]|uniref:Filamentous hemagglutinin n=1 Tax=Pseudomonas cremoricolorata TaxID=157783 RepID=A0A089WLB1_9PSED|nr:hemagglutinin repeat-containing protein [Pseudomonas cremoricolorata]AIR87929.1 filamentous hemagglutinin [Pseudomonas cremoricolorata]
MTDLRHPPLRADTLRWTIFLCLATPASGFANPGLEAAAGPGGTPLINPGHGVPVIDIVAPNGHGLSHNQFLDYNVGAAGLVMNNALEPGQSQLAGALAANPQFQGQAASTIINEVISSNASLVAGAQEIFGRPADYILANPNGISLNGASFINTTRAGFLVGKPLLDDPQHIQLDTLHASGQLSVLEGGVSHPGGALDLVAPKVVSQGPIDNGGELSIIAGRNRLLGDSLEVLEHLPGEPGAIDASLFGAMRAGRIRIVSTGEGAGVRLGAPHLEADEGISVSSAGALTVEGSAQRKAHLQVKRGELKLGAADDLSMSAVTGSADRIDVSAGKKLTLDGKTREKVTRQNEAWSNTFLFVTNETYSSDTTTTERSQQGVMLSARDEVNLNAGSDLRLTGATVEAGQQVSVKAAGDVDIDAALDSRRTQVEVRHRKNLWRGDKDTDHYEETADPSVLKGNQVLVDAGGDLHIKGSRLEAEQHMELKGQHVEVADTQVRDERGLKDYRGDLVSGTFFADRQGSDSKASNAVGSTLRSEGTLKVTAQQATIRGSQVTSQGDGVVYSEQGLLEVSSALSKRERSDTQSDSQLFSLFGSNSEKRQSDQQVLTSDVNSTSNLRLASAGEMKIEGARIAAAQQLEMSAAGDLTITSAASTHTGESHQQQRGLNASAGQTREADGDKPGSRQFEAGVGYEVVSVDERTRSTQQTGSQLQGANVVLTSGETLRVDGSKVTAEAGDLKVTAPRIETGVTRNETEHEETTTHSGGGLQVSGGIDKLGSQFEGHRLQTRIDEQDSTVQRSELRATGDITLDSKELVNEGARIEAGKTLLATAERIENRAAEDTHSREETIRDWRGSLGASLEYRDLTRPIERLVEGSEAARFQQASTEDAMSPPSLGADAGLAHLRKDIEHTEHTAQVTELSGAAVQVKADQILDIGTDYRADEGQLQIDAQEHQMLAAYDRSSHREHIQQIDGTLRVDTSTGQDINGRITAGVSQSDTASEQLNARVGSLQGQTGVQVQLGSDGLYEGTRIDGGSGPVVVEAAQGLQFSTALDSVSKDHTQFDGSLWSKGGNRPGKTGVDVRGYADYPTYQSQDRTAHAAQIDTSGAVTLRGGSELNLEGVRIGTRQAPVAATTLESAGVVQVLAGANEHSASGKTLGGGAEVAASQGAMSGGGLGGHLTNGKIDEQSSTALDPSIHTSGTLRIASQAREDQAIHLQGLQANAKAIELEASKGGMLIESSANLERRDNLELTAGAGFSLSKAEAPSDDIRALHGRVKVDVDKRNEHTFNDSALRADQVTVSSAGDVSIEGARIDADQVRGSVGGDLLVASRKDARDSTSVQVDARLSQEKNPQGYLNAVSSLAGPAAGKVQEKAGDTVASLDPTWSPTLKVDVQRQQSDGVAHASAIKGNQGIRLDVGGDTRLVGARLQAPQGAVELGGGNLSLENLRGQDYRRDINLDASNSAVDLGTAVAEITKNRGAADGDNAVDLGLIRTSGHSNSSEWQAGIIEQRRSE